MNKRKPPKKPKQSLRANLSEHEILTTGNFKNAKFLGADGDLGMYQMENGQVIFVRSRRTK